MTRGWAVPAAAIIFLSFLKRAGSRAFVAALLQALMPALFFKRVSSANAFEKEWAVLRVGEQHRPGPETGGVIQAAKTL